jgi:uncharacterized protein YggE
MTKFVAIVLACVGLMQAQSTAARPSVTALGTSTVLVQPDQVSLDISVMTQAGKAKDALSRNAEQVMSLRASLAKALGSGAEIKTVRYSAIRRASSGYSVNSTMEITSDTPAMAGDIIDAAAAAGATSVGEIRFELKRRDLVQQQALQAATAQAMAHAESMARGLGRTLGVIVAIREGGTNAPLIDGYFNRDSAKAPSYFATATVLDPGPIKVESTVVLEVQLN